MNLFLLSNGGWRQKSEMPVSGLDGSQDFSTFEVATELQNRHVTNGTNHYSLIINDQTQAWLKFRNLLKVGISYLLTFSPLS